MNLNYGAFKAWLESFPADAAVGQRRVLCDCPLARFLKATESISDAEVLSSIIFYYKKDQPYQFMLNTPTWAYNFIKTVDIDRSTTEITAAEALSYL